MRISEWAEKFGVWIEPAEARPGQTVYRVKDIFTTRDGSWEPSDKPGSVPQWARDAYLKPPHHPQYNDDGGADRHLFGAVALPDGMRPHGTFHFWTYPDDANHTNQRVKLHGWANIEMYKSSSFVPERGERGWWAWQPQENADVVKGGGLPSNWHVSYFAVWEPVVIPVEPEPPIEPPVEPVDDGPVLERLSMLERRFNALSSIVKQQERDIDALRIDNAGLKALLRQWVGEL